MPHSMVVRIYLLYVLTLELPRKNLRSVNTRREAKQSEARLFFRPPVYNLCARNIEKDVRQCPADFEKNFEVRCQIFFIGIQVQCLGEARQLIPWK